MLRKRRQNTRQNSSKKRRIEGNDEPQHVRMLPIPDPIFMQSVPAPASSGYSAQSTILRDEKVMTSTIQDGDKIIHKRIRQLVQIETVEEVIEADPIPENEIDEYLSKFRT